jgi:myo-inositol-1(or 4)-monophosphatase
MATLSRVEREELVGVGGDGTPTFLLDELVEAPVLDVFERHGVNVLSEEIGWIDRGSAVTVVVDPVDGTANAAAGVPLAAFAAALAIDGDVVEALALWLDADRWWWAHRDHPSARRTTGRTQLAGAAVSMLRPRPATLPAWTRIATVADRVRVLGTSVIEGCLVADGAIDAFCDPGGDVHRIVDLAATALVVERAGGAVLDLHGRPFTLEPDLSLRWSGVVAATEALAVEMVDALLDRTTAG